MSSSGRSAAVVLALALALGSCEGARPRPQDASPRFQQSIDERSRSAGRDRSAFLPGPHLHIPRGRERLARLISKTTPEVRRSVRRWLPGARLQSRPPRRVVLLSLLLQRIYRVLARDRRLARAVAKRLDGRSSRELKTNVRARRRLDDLATPIVDVEEFETGPPEPPRVLLGYYRAAQRRFGVAWQVLAATNLVESNFGRARATSHAGAQGPMQFLPRTWDAYGLGGDVQDPRDAIFGAANYLRASGAPHDYRAALYAYNPSSRYVAAVMSYARQMMRRPHDFYLYYCWQVFVRTPQGDVRLTGPGARQR
jgi:hypothetical protein